jgi:hypothetical protein
MTSIYGFAKTGIGMALVGLLALGGSGTAHAQVRFAIQLQGNTSFGTPFVRTGTLTLTNTITNVTTNGVNPVDVYLASGTPAVRPEVGAINFATNNGFFGLAHIDLAFVKLEKLSNGYRVTVQPDWRIAASYGNYFTVSPGLTTFPYNINSGSMVLVLSRDLSHVSGTIDIADVLKGTHYQAVLAGVRQ